MASTPAPGWGRRVELSPVAGRGRRVSFRPWLAGVASRGSARGGLGLTACAGARLRPTGSTRPRPGPHRALMLQPGNLGGGQAEFGEDLLVVLAGQWRRAPH